MLQQVREQPAALEPAGSERKHRNRRGDPCVQKLRAQRRVRALQGDWAAEGGAAAIACCCAGTARLKAAASTSQHPRHSCQRLRSYCRIFLYSCCHQNIRHL